MPTVPLTATTTVTEELAGEIQGAHVPLTGTFDVTQYWSEQISIVESDLEVEVKCQGSLKIASTPVAPPGSAEEVKSVSFVMPTPTLDQFGRPE